MTAKTDRKTYGTTITSVYRGKQTKQPDHPSEKEWIHHLWDVTLTREGSDPITFAYRMGEAHEQTACGKPKPSSAVFSRYRTTPAQVCQHARCEKAGWVATPPTLYDALTALKADRTDGETFHDWAGNFGMDTDSIRAQAMYFACQESENRSRRFFGSDWFAICEDEDYE